MNRSCFRVIGSINQPANSGVNHGARAHGARLNCSKQVAVDQTVVTEVLSRLAEGDDLGVAGWVIVGDVAVGASANDASFTDDNGADWNVSGLERALGRAKRFFHPEFVHLVFVRPTLVRARLIHQSSSIESSSRVDWSREDVKKSPKTSSR
jgi:hypothetical protein